MDSAKKMKLSPETDEFQLFLPPTTSPSELTVAPAVAEAPSDDRFKVPGIFLEVLWSDAAFREQWDQIIADKVEKKFAAEQDELRAKTIAAARAEGLEQGLRDAEAMVSDIEAKLKVACEKVLSEKETLLHSHERQWCDAMLHMLRRFLVRRPDEIVSVIDAWLDDCLKSFAQKSKVRVYLSADDHALVQQAFSFRANRGPVNHEFGIDRNLSSGEVRAECDGGGIFFSPGQELSELEGYLDGIFKPNGEEE